MPITRALPRSLAALAVLAALAACADDRATGPTGPNHATATEPVATDSVVEPDTLATPPDTVIYEGEQEYEDIARQVPGYAGHYYDEQGNREVQLTDLSQQDLALRVLDSRPQPELAEGETHTGVTHFVQAKYDFATLRDTRNQVVESVLKVQGVSIIDLEEQRNRVLVGVVDDAARAAVEEQLLASRVFAGAVAVEVTGAPEAFQTLQNFFRPLRSGYQIQNGLAGTCTLGPPGLTRAPSYFTNSHCTQFYWWNTGTAFFQHVVGGAFFIGREVADPPGWPCFGGWVCRWSDAALIGVAGGVPAANQIARPAFPGFHWAPGSINTAGGAAWGILNPPLWWPFAGQWVDKVGRTTGWNRGIVTNTCVILVAPPPAPPGRAVLCQYLMTNMAGPGDSGSPVFQNLGGNARVAGILWGGIVTPWFKRSIFSPRGAVFADFGV